MLALYWSSGGPRWNNQTGWAENDPDLGVWHGVTVDGHGRVMRLDLNRNALEGDGNPVLLVLAFGRLGNDF